jgi:hypothetical protein
MVKSEISKNMTLPEYITSKLQAPFAWGTHDCVCFAIGWVSIASGKSLLDSYDKWGDEISATKAIKKYGGIEKQLDKQIKRINPNMAKDGDVALVDGTVYLFSGNQIVGPGKSGLVFKSRMEAKCAWSF